MSDVRDEWCVWRQVEGQWADYYWETQCDNAHQFIDGNPADNQYRFCPYCGGIIASEPTPQGGE